MSQLIEASSIAQRGHPLIELTSSGSERHVRVLAAQKGTYRDLREFDTDWPDDLLLRLADLKREWFVDSYQRFEHPNYLQKHIDTVLDLYGVRLEDNPVLDFGCGFGASSYCMMRRGATRIVACDLEKSNTDFAEAFFAGRGLDSRIDIRHGDIVPDLRSGSYAVIWLQAVMEHLLPDERRTYLRRFWEALRSGGTLIITETPNRTWPIEGHTTGGTWWLPWMTPQRVFARMRRTPKYSGYSDEQFYRSGIIGSSYAEILNCLGSSPHTCDEVSLRTEGYLGYLYSHALKRSLGRATAVKALELMDPIARKFLRRPMTAFMPFLNHLVFKKI